MNSKDLLKELSKPIGKLEAIDLAKQNLNSVEFLIDLCFHKSYETAFRAAWITEIIAQSYPDKFFGHIDKFINNYCILKNRSSQRHFTKILMALTGDERKANQIPSISLESIIDVTFEWLIDPHTPVAVKVNCMDILFYFKDVDDWIADELRAQIEYQMKDGSAALQSRGKKILRKLPSTKGKH